MSVVVVEPERHDDERGWFRETFRADRYEALGIPAQFAQDSLSWSKKHVLRGLHLQDPPQGKLVSCLQGAVWDVAVDVRKGSPTFGTWEAHELSGENGRQLWIPEGYAHGFVVLSDGALFTYKSTAPYEPKGQIAIRWDDPDLGIEWPVAEPVLSPRDASAPPLNRS